MNADRQRSERFFRKHYDRRTEEREWRLANGKAFAVIMRVYNYSSSDLCTSDGKITGESLVEKGLKGFEQIDETVNTKTPNANVKARELADKGYTKTKT